MKAMGLFSAVAFLVAAGWPNDHRANDIADIIQSYRDVVEAIQTWEGSVSIHEQKGAGPLELYAEGEFSWDAVRDRRHCRLRFPTRRGKISPNGEVEAWDDENDREVVITGDTRTAVWHNLPGLPFHSITLPADRSVQRDVPVATRRHLKQQSLIVPNLEFCPEYMFRGNLPSIVRLLTDLSEAARTPQTPKVTVERRPLSAHRVMIITSITVSATQTRRDAFTMERITDRWVPKAYEGSGTSVAWNWDEIDGVLIPVRLENDTKPTGRRVVYSLENNKVNHKIADARFEVASMDFSTGTILADDVDDVLFEYDGTKFVPLNGARSWREIIRSLAGPLAAMVLLFALVVACALIRRRLKCTR